MNAPTTTRRDMLRLGTSAAAYATGAAIVTGGIAVASEARGATIPDATWRRVCAEYEAAQQMEAAAAREEDRCSVLFFKWRAANPAPEQPASPPLDTSRPLRDIIADTDAPEWKARWAAYEGDLVAWTAASDAKHVALVGDADERHTDAMHATEAAFDRIRTYPVTSLAMLAEKAAIMHARFGGDMDSEDALALVRDIRRLNGEAGA